MENGKKYLRNEEVIDLLMKFLKNKIDRESIFNWAKNIDDELEEGSLILENKKIKEIIDNLLYINDIDPNLLMAIYKKNRKDIKIQDKDYLISRDEIKKYIEKLKGLVDKY